MGLPTVKNQDEVHVFLVGESEIFVGIGQVKEVVDNKRDRRVETGQKFACDHELTEIVKAFTCRWEHIANNRQQCL